MKRTLLPVAILALILPFRASAQETDPSPVDSGTAPSVAGEPASVSSPGTPDAADRARADRRKRDGKVIFLNGLGMTPAFFLHPILGASGLFLIVVGGTKYITARKGKEAEAFTRNEEKPAVPEYWEPGRRRRGMVDGLDAIDP